MAEPYPVGGRNLVIDRHLGSVLARRLDKAPGSLGISPAPQTPSPRTPRRTMTYDQRKVRVQRVVGAIFTDMPYPRPAGEKTLVHVVPELAQIIVAYHVCEGGMILLA